MPRSGTWVPNEYVETLYTFRVRLQWYHGVWRTIAMGGWQTLEDLHYSIQKAFGWDNSHLYSFFLNGKPWDKKTAYTIADGGAHGVNVMIATLGLKPRQNFLYLFDFGDELWHIIRVMNIKHSVDTGNAKKYPRIVEYHGKAPPQYGYNDDDDGEDE